jgi:hypothetical protein
MRSKINLDTIKKSIKIKVLPRSIDSEDIMLIFILMMEIEYSKAINLSSGEPARGPLYMLPMIDKTMYTF